MPRTKFAELATSLDAVRRSNRATLTIAEVAELLNIDPRTVSAAARAKEIPSVRLGRRVLIPREPFLAFLDEKQEKSHE